MRSGSIDRKAQILEKATRLFSDAGYATALHGKWHVGSKVGRLPNNHGYDEWWGINEGSNAAGYTSTPQFDPKVAQVPHIWEGKKGEESTKVRIYDVDAKSKLDRETTERTISFINKNSKDSKPFFTYVGFTHFHPPWGVHPDFDNKSKAGIYATRRVKQSDMVKLQKATDAKIVSNLKDLKEEDLGNAGSVEEKKISSLLFIRCF